MNPKAKHQISLYPLLAILFLAIIYLSGILNDDLIILGVMLFLAEPHFALSWPWILSKKFGSIYDENRFWLIFIPLGIILASVFIVWQFGLLTFSYLFLFANIYHVNRQSLGIWKLLGLPKELFKSADIDIHTISLVYLFFHFYFNGRYSIDTEIRLFYSAIIFLIVCVYFTLRYRLWTRDLGVDSGALQAVLVFAPLMFIEQPLLAMAIGISIHYVQYLILAGGIAKFELNRFKVLTYLALYVSVMTLSQTILKSYSDWLVLVASIPQLLHFYLDGFFWRFSNPIIRSRFYSAFK